DRRPRYRHDRHQQARQDERPRPRHGPRAHRARHRGHGGPRDAGGRPPGRRRRLLDRGRSPGDRREPRRRPDARPDDGRRVRTGALGAHRAHAGDRRGQRPGGRRRRLARPGRGPDVHGRGRVPAVRVHQHRTHAGRRGQRPVARRGRPVGGLPDPAARCRRLGRLGARPRTGRGRAGPAGVGRGRGQGRPTAGPRPAPRARTHQEIRVRLHAHRARRRAGAGARGPERAARLRRLRRRGRVDPREAPPVVLLTARPHRQPLRPPRPSEKPIRQARPTALLKGRTMTTTAADPTAELHAARRNTWNTWVATHAEMNPDGEALRYLGDTTTWAQLHRDVGAFADALARRGVTAGDRVMLITLNSPQFVEAVLGINELGAIAVPVNFRLTPGELAYLVSDCTPKAVVTDAMLAPLVDAIRAQGEEPGEHFVIGGEPGTENQTTFADALAEEGEPHAPVDVRE